MLHSLSSQEEFDRLYINEGILDYLREEKAQGRIRSLGFSFHGDVPFFYDLLDRYPWDFCMIQLNYADWNEPGEAPSGGRQAGDLYRKCREKDVPIFVMEPVKGGTLAKLPESVETMFHAHSPAASNASWAIRFAASCPEVFMVLSGMSDMQQMRENTSFMQSFTPLNETELAAIEQVKTIFRGMNLIPCTAAGIA